MFSDESVQLLLSEVKSLREQVNTLNTRSIVKDHYTTEEFAALKGYTKPKTVRDYCWLGMLRGVKQRNGRWVIPHSELLRYERDGLLTPARRE